MLGDTLKCTSQKRCFGFTALLKLIKEQSRENWKSANFLDLQLLITIASITGPLHLMKLFLDDTTPIEMKAQPTSRKVYKCWKRQ